MGRSGHRQEAYLPGTEIIGLGVAAFDGLQGLDDTDLRTTQDLMRRFSGQVLAEPLKAISQRHESALGLPRPRLVAVTEFVYEPTTRMPEVVVTDGHRVSRTLSDRGYRFELRMDENPHHRFVAVTCPTGYRPTSGFFLRVP